MTVLGYFELPEDDAPPENLYGNDEALSRHFEQVRNRHRNPDSAGMEAVPEAPMSSNSLVDDLGLRG